MTRAALSLCAERPLLAVSKQDNRRGPPPVSRWGRVRGVWSLFFLGGLLSLVASCARPEAPNRPPTSQPAAPLVVTTAPAASVPDATVKTPPIKTRPDSCEANADCGWDSSCLPTRCVSAKRSPGLIACDESSPPPGECLCADNYCTLKPKRLPAPVALGCKADADCLFEPSSGTCGARQEFGQGPINKEGAFCTCEPTSGACSVEWVGPVACKTYKDCSWLRAPLRPVPSSLIPRPQPRPVKACSTGEVDSVCKEGVCVVVGWSC